LKSNAGVKDGGMTHPVAVKTQLVDALAQFFLAAGKG
jgi:hypothetical protein